MALILVNRFDYDVIAWLNGIAARFPEFAKFVVAIYGDQLKTALFGALLWWKWFDTDAVRKQEIREKITAGLIGSLLCLTIVRTMVLTLPFRMRPVADLSAGFHFPTTGSGWAGDWSSFPSDNAAMFFALTVCLFSVSRWLGTIALVDTVFLICFPRIFVGIHYPTDILAGSLIGIAIGCWITSEQGRTLFAKPILSRMENHAALFYAAAFLMTFLLATTFNPILVPLIDLWHMHRHLHF